jgi:hypothetical protein
MELGRLGLDGPTRRRKSGCAAWRPGLRTGADSAERSTGLGCDGAEDPEDEEQRAAGRPGPKS